MNFKYTIDPSVDEPIMLIDKHIGMDAEDGIGIDGSEFSRELLYLDSIGKKQIQIRINSVGGSVMDGMTIYNAILKTKAKVDTYNVGICASIAGVIFQAGRNRIMADYSLLMMHNPQGGDKKVLKIMKESLVTMLTRKANKTEAEIAKMMDATTWLTATECLTSGLCDMIEESIEFNKPRIKSADVQNAYKEAVTIINSFNQKSKPMLNVINKLGLESDATEEMILASIEAIENKSKEEIEKAKNDLDEAENKVSELKKKVAEMEEAKNAMEEEAKKKAEEDCKNKATELVSNAVKLGKIANKEEVIASWTNLAVSDFDNASIMLDSLTVNKAGINIDNKEDANQNGLENAAMNAMIEIQNKLKL